MGQNATTLDAMQASLDELLRAADAHGTLRKAMGGVDIDTYGHTDERGKTSGGYAEAGDAGKGVNLAEQAIVGKMSEAGLNAAQIGHLVGYMKDGGFFDHERPSPKGKMHGYASDEMDEDGGQGPSMPPFKGKADEEMDDEEEDEEEGEEDEDEEEPVGKRSMRKSFARDFASDPDISETVDVSPFLEAITSRTVSGLDSLSKSLRKSERRQDRVNGALAGALYQMGTLLKSQSRVIDALSSRLGIVERQPASGRGATTLTGAQAMQKSFVGGGAGGSLKKSEVLSALSYMRMSKGMNEINGRAIGDVIYAFEGGGIIQPDDLATVERFLATHPAEAAKAKNFT